MLALTIYLIIAFFSISVPFISIWIIDNKKCSKLSDFLTKHVIHREKDLTKK